MLYRVRAKPIEARMPEFFKLLVDGTIENQEPDGSEIIASMRRATFENGQAEWYETCYCNPPLRHERTTVYDRFFTNMQVEPAKAHPQPTAASFWAQLLRETSRIETSRDSAVAGSMSRALGRNTV